MSESHSDQDGSAFREFLASPGYKLARGVLAVFGASYSPGKPSGEAVRLCREFIKDEAAKTRDVACDERRPGSVDAGEVVP